MLVPAVPRITYVAPDPRGARGASNAKAKKELGWTLRCPSWREGFAAVYRG